MFQTSITGATIGQSDLMHANVICDRAQRDIKRAATRSFPRITRQHGAPQVS